MQKSYKKIWITAVVLLIMLVAAGAGGWFYVNGLAYNLCRVEAGVEVKPSDFLKKPDETSVFAEGTQFDTTVPGEYQVNVKSGLFTHSCRLIVEDTTPPVAVATTIKLKTGEICEPADFITELTDVTEVAISWGTEPDFTQPGVQTVTIMLTDLGGNTTQLETELFLSKVEDIVVMEAGGALPAIADFVLTGEDASFITNLESLNFTKVGDYKIYMSVGGETCSSVLHVEDTIPPRFEVHDLEGFCMAKRDVMEFVSDAEDATTVTFSFEEEPDWSLEGEQEVHILATDAGGNQVRKTAMLNLLADTEAPVIQGVADLKAFLGESVSYRKNITVTDNSQVEPVLTIDTSQVNLEEPGVYPVVYSAQDGAGNTTSVTVQLTVELRLYTQEEVDVLADAVLAEIITEDMTPRDKAQAIFNWVIWHVAYISHSYGDDWVRSAYEGLALRQGDCRVYAATSKELLTRAGIPNMDIEKIPSRTMHYWNLVDVGEGWLHFDTCPRIGQRGFFLWTEAELMEYSAVHYGTHNYDHDAYPQVN